MEYNDAKVWQIVSFVIIALSLTIIFIVFYGGHASLFGYHSESDLISHFIYPFFHANIFHLLGNLLGIYFIARHIKSIIVSYFIAVIASFIAYSSMPTIGFSGVLYAFIGLSGLLFNKNVSKVTIAIMLIYVLIGLLLPTINGFLHITCLVLGCLFFLIKKKLYGYIRDLQRII